MRGLMKKRFFGLILIALFAVTLGVSALFAACAGGGDKADYSVTVLSPDETPLSGITVSWMTGNAAAGSAQTDAEGKASASLVVGTYTVSLAGYGEELDYTSVSVSSAMRDVELQLSVKKINYTVTVTDKDGALAANVSVNWSKDGRIAGTATTGADGKAEKELDYGEYSVTLSALPDGNIYDGAKTVDGKNPEAQFSLKSGETVVYSVTVRSEGGLLFKDQSLFVDKGETQITSGWTDEETGVFTFKAVPDNYTVTAAYLQDGYSCEPLTLTADKTEGELILYSEVIASQPVSGLTYVMGDIFHNYSFTTPYEINGKAWSGTVAEILQKKEVLIINNWGTQCSWCVKEMPAMQEAYEKYSDKIEIVAVSNYQGGDSDQVVAKFYADNGYAFPMMRDVNGFVEKFGIKAHPTTVVIDRYGAVARIEAGAITSFEAWERLLLKYIGADYVQTFVPGEKESPSINTEMAKPDVELEDDHYEKLAETMNGEGADIDWFGETDYEYAWPFLIGTVEGVSPDEAVMYSSNAGKANSMSIIYATVNIEAGKVFTFDYYADTEDYDVFYIIWDGKIIKEIYGNSGGWQTCYLYADLISGRHNLSMTYMKDYDGNDGKDNVYLRNVRYLDVEDIAGSVDMLRCAAYGTPAAGEATFPYYAETERKSDGYYHVKLDSLESKRYAGNDESPLLLANLLGVTAWFNTMSINELVLGIDENTNEYLIDCTFTVNGEERDYRGDFVEYLRAASASDVEGFVPVDGFLHDLLVALTEKVSAALDESYHPDAWLEICYFYSHYGAGSPVGDPVLGLMKRSAIPVTEGTHDTGDYLTRNMYPFPTVKYTFTPTADAVYKIESLIPEGSKYLAQAWLYDDETNPDDALAYSGDTRIVRDGVNEQNFEIYRYMKAGEKYYIEVAFLSADSGKLDFKISNAGQSVTVTTQCSDDVYDMVLDEFGNITDQIVLAGAVDVSLEKDGYYHAKNPDGTVGDYIYLDVINVVSGALGNIPLARLIDVYESDPKDYSKLDYKIFDFRYCIVYYINTDADGNETADYNPKVDLTEADAEKYKDCTEILRKYIESAPTEGEYKGLVKVNRELVDILTTFIELRVNGVYEDKIESALENEWLRFCFYDRTYNENNP